MVSKCDTVAAGEDIQGTSPYALKSECPRQCQPLSRDLGTHPPTQGTHTPPRPRVSGGGGRLAQRGWGGLQWKQMLRRPWRSTTSPPGAGRVGETASKAWPGEVGLSDRGCRRLLSGRSRGRVCAGQWGVQLRGWSRAPWGAGETAWPGSHTRVTGNVQITLLEGHVHRLRTRL